MAAFVNVSIYVSIFHEDTTRQAMMAFSNVLPSRTKTYFIQCLVISFWLENKIIVLKFLFFVQILLRHHVENNNTFF